MKIIRDLLDKVEPLFNDGGKLEKFHPLFEATDTILFSTDERTKSGPHIRDSIDIKRVMISVVIALIPCYIFGAINIGYQRSLTFGEDTSLIQNFQIGILVNLIITQILKMQLRLLIITVNGMIEMQMILKTLMLNSKDQ